MRKALGLPRADRDGCAGCSLGLGGAARCLCPGPQPLGQFPSRACPCRCEITSREYCDFMRGYFHEEATLCSQVGLRGVCVPSPPAMEHADRPL